MPVKLFQGQQIENRKQQVYNRKKPHFLSRKWQEIKGGKKQKIKGAARSCGGSGSTAAVGDMYAAAIKYNFTGRLSLEKHNDYMPQLVEQAGDKAHKGCSIVECLVNCVIFNNGTHAWIADREQRAEHSIILKHGEKMIFGKNNDKGLAVEIDPQTFVPKMIVVPAGDPRVLTHDATQPDPTLHRLLSLMGQNLVTDVNTQPTEDSLPIALGVIRSVEAETYDEAVNKQIADVREHAKAHNFDELTATLDSWQV